MKKTINNLDIDVHSKTLDNGLRIFIVPMKNLNNIYATFSTKYGSNNIEFKPLNKKEMYKSPLGIAHFLEHKLFEQSDGTDPFTFFSERGSDANANTNQTKTTYLFSGPEFFEENINFLLDYVQSPYFTDKNVEKEKGIIEQEIKMYLDDAGTQLYEKTLYNCFSVNPMKYPIIGTIESINSITKEDLYECYNTFYHPSNMFLVITGNIDPEYAIEIIEKNQKKKEFKKQAKIENKIYDEPDKVVKQHEEISLNVGIPKCSLAYKIKLPKENRYQTLLYYSILFDALFGGTSTLGEELRNEKIINTNLGFGYDNTDKHLIAFITGETKNPDLLFQEIKDTINNIKISKEEFERKKKVLLSYLIFISEKVFALNHIIMNDIIKYDDIKYEKYDDIKKLNYEDFSNLIKKTDFKNFTTFIINPK